jgi:hypothetical protein
MSDLTPTPLTDAEREAIAPFFRDGSHDENCNRGCFANHGDADALVAAVEETVAARVAAARADERDRVVADLARDWRLLRNHHPVGAYHPVGQLDGDCACGDGTWPCSTIHAALAQPTDTEGA